MSHIQVLIVAFCKGNGSAGKIDRSSILHAYSSCCVTYFQYKIQIIGIRYEHYKVIAHKNDLDSAYIFSLIPHIFA